LQGTSHLACPGRFSLSSHPCLPSTVALLPPTIPLAKSVVFFLIIPCSCCGVCSGTILSQGVLTAASQAVLTLRTPAWVPATSAGLRLQKAQPLTPLLVWPLVIHLLHHATVALQALASLLPSNLLYLLPPLAASGPFAHLAFAQVCLVSTPLHA
jgi:hypothetical protein